MQQPGGIGAHQQILPVPVTAAAIAAQIDDQIGYLPDLDKEAFQLCLGRFIAGERKAVDLQVGGIAVRFQR